MAIIPSWTNVHNYFVLSSTTPHSTLGSSLQYAQGGPFALSEIAQIADLPDGWQYGEAVMHLARMNALPGDKGEAIIEALDSDGEPVSSATTGETWYATTGIWHRERVVLRLPPQTAKLRVRLVAKRAGSLGNSGACFNDLSIRVYKDLAPVDVLDLDFSSLPVQPVPATWQQVHLAWPAITESVIIAQGSLVVSAPRQYTGESIAWSDGLTRDPGTFVAPFGGGVERLPSFAFVRAAAGDAVDVQVTGGAKQRGAFTASGSFTVSATLKIDEALTVAAGICGRRAADGTGWGLSLTASGQVRATLQGTDGARTATSADSIADGAAHRVTMAYSASEQMLRLYVDRRAVVETSTSSALGEFAVASAPLRIGRDAATSATFTGQILDVLLVPRALTANEARALWTLGSDPTGEIDTYTRSAPAWVELEGGRLACMATDQIALGHRDGLTGIATCHAVTNLVPSFDFLSASWTWDGDTITKTSPTVAGVYDAVAFSVEALTGDGYVETTITGTTMTKAIGLSATDASPHWNTIQFGFLMDTTILTVRESGGLRYTGTCAVGDVLRVERTGSTVRYYQNGALRYTSLVASSGPLHADTAMLNQNAVLANVKLIDDGTPVNLTWNTANVTIAPGVQQTHGVEDPTGLERGASYATTPTAGVRLVDVPVSSVYRIGVTFWARATLGAPTVNLRLKNASGVVKQTVPVALAPAGIDRWFRYDVEFTAWDGSTPTCQVEWVGAASFEMCHVVAVYQPATAAEFHVPTLIPGPGVALAAVTPVVMRAMPAQWSAEGEMDVRGVALTASPPQDASVARVSGSGDANARHVRVATAASPAFALHDGLGAATVSEATAINWSQPWRLRARWSRASTLDNAPTPYGGLIVEGSADSAVYARTSAWTDLAAPVDTVTIGGVSALISRLTLRTPGRKLE